MLGQIAGLAFCPSGMVQNVGTVNNHPAGAGCQAAGDDLHGGGLAGTIGSQKTQDLAPFDFEAHAAHGGVVAVVSLQSFDAYQDLI